MTLPLTPDTLRAAYDFLNTTPPFSRWNLPDGEDITFRVARTRRWYGQHTHSVSMAGRREHVIEVSGGSCGHTITLLETMAHEMIHVHDHHNCVGRSDVAHGAMFRQYAAQVCRHHGFDPKRF